METINCELEVLTPMFLGGALRENCELRTQSIKGALRFWYRALLGEKELKKEMELFGSSSESIGASKIRISIKNKMLDFSNITNDEDRRLPEGLGRKIRDQMNPIAYLAYGPIENLPTGQIKKSGKPVKKLMFGRNYIKPGSNFELEVKLLTESLDFIEDFYKVLWLWLNFGGLGSRSRNGLGSLQSRNSNLFSDFEWSRKQNIREILKNIINNKTDMPYSKRFSYLCNNTKLWRSKNLYSSWEECLWNLGLNYYSWRSSLSGKGGRKVIGLPLGEEDGRRRASSYFFKVFKEENRYGFRVLFMPAKFLDFEDEYLKKNNKIFQQMILKNTIMEV
ncbi:MAG: type III-B CRISPR module RAMP protein Cmr1 [Deltaproteobacteria bacterium]|nr:type III-B CRISPR module RAMP protein Cmr1 [Deltaproteobacteria bacterium]